MTRLDEQLARLTPAQRALFELKLRERRQQPVSPAIGRRTDRTAHELSFAQERLWFVERLLPEGGANHITGAVRLQGPLSDQALSHSLNQIVRRHEVLRSRY